MSTIHGCVKTIFNKKLKELKLMDYGDNSIKTITGVEHYRLRPSMYGFRTGFVDGLLLMVKEILDNSTDESIDPNKIYTINTTFFVAKDRSTYQCLIQDFGRGIPVGKLVDCLATANTSGKYDLDSYGAASTGTNGVGSKVVAALSKLFYGFTKRMDGFAYLKMEQGKVKDSFMTRRPIDKNKETCGTTIMFQPDPVMMTAIPEFFKKDESESPNGYSIMKSNLVEYAIFHRNSKIVVRLVEGLLKPQDLSKKPEELWRYLTNLDNFKAVKDFEPDLSITPRQFVINKFGLSQPIWELPEKLYRERNLAETQDRIGFDIDIFTDEKSLKDNGGIIGAVNYTPISDKNSIHISMLQSVLKMYLEDYILDKDKATFFTQKYILPLSGYVSAIWVGASFDGQDKSKFTDTKFGDIYRILLRKQLNKVPEATWERLFELIHEHFEMAYAKYARAQFKVGSDLKGITYKLKRAGSYIPCESRDREVIELYIVEGDSAGGRVKTVRDGATQAVYKLSGKPTNPARTDAKKLTKDMIYMDLMEIIGVRPTDKDLSNMKFARIIILTDADADGEHITALVTEIIRAINALILEAGRVFYGCPPLYSFFVKGQKRPFYLRNQEALQQCKNFIYKYLLSIYVRPTGKKMIKLEGDAFDALCYIVCEVGDRVKFVANQLNINPMDMERMLHVVQYLTAEPDVDKIKKTLGVDNAMWNKTANTLTLVDYGIDISIPLTHLREALEDRVLPLYEKFGWRGFDLFISTNYTDLYVQAPCTFMMLHEVFDSITETTNSNAFIIRRFKGLGEMAEEEIDETCVNPLTRTLIRITGVGDVNRIYALLGNDSAYRKQLIETNVHDKLVDKGFLDK